MLQGRGGKDKGGEGGTREGRDKGGRRGKSIVSSDKTMLTHCCSSSSRSVWDPSACPARRRSARFSIVWILCKDTSLKFSRHHLYAGGGSLSGRHNCANFYTHPPTF